MLITSSSKGVKYWSTIRESAALDVTSLGGSDWGVTLASSTGLESRLESLMGPNFANKQQYCYILMLLQRFIISVLHACHTFTPVHGYTVHGYTCCYMVAW